MIVLSFLYLLSCNSQKKFEIRQVLLEEDSLSRTEYFLILGDLPYTPELKDSIRKYVKIAYEPMAKNYNHFHLLFYKPSSELNLEEIKKMPSNLKWKLFTHEPAFVTYYFYYGRYAAD